MKYDKIKNLQIRYKKPIIEGNPLTDDQIGNGNLVIDGVHLVEVETFKMADQKLVVTRVSANFKLIHENQEHQIWVYFAIICSKEDSNLELELDDIDWIQTPGIDIQNLEDEAGEELFINRHEEILHLMTLCGDWQALAAWIRSELRYRLSH